MEMPKPYPLSEGFKSVELILSFLLNRRDIGLLISPVPTTWMILYDAHELKTLFYDVISIFIATWPTNRMRQRPGTVRITFKADDPHLLVQITMRHILVSPFQWEHFLNAFKECATYEHLRELGGDIEPLAWDEGYGQGIIVRLPWAHL